MSASCKLVEISFHEIEPVGGMLETQSAFSFLTDKRVGRNAHVIKDGSVVHKYTERACFGEKAMMAEADDWLEVATRAATVQAVEPGATCMRLTNTAFHSLDKVKEALESSGA